ncbi:MAG: response regulator transcription factor [Desulfosarcina sp.]|nr:response regulator transcription factor [Desulfosarcina sp.]MBC2766896.1 response regulator transcription factor [Desulfosarcina sp.]
MKIFIADDDALQRLTLRIALNQEKDMRVIGEDSDGLGILKKVRACIPDVALIDVDMPGLSGMDAIRTIRSALPQVKLLMLSNYSDDNLVQEALTTGADGYILKAVEHLELISILRAVYHGQRILSSFLLTIEPDVEMLKHAVG